MVTIIFTGSRQTRFFYWRGPIIHCLNNFTNSLDEKYQRKICLKFQPIRNKNWPQFNNQENAARTCCSDKCSTMNYIIGLHSSCMCKQCRCNHKLNKYPKDVYVKFVSASAPFTHAQTPEKNCSILIIFPFEFPPYFDY
jgi:hypothetical protein